MTRSRLRGCIYICTYAPTNGLSLVRQRERLPYEAARELDAVLQTSRRDHERARPDRSRRVRCPLCVSDPAPARSNLALRHSRFGQPGCRFRPPLVSIGGGRRCPGIDLPLLCVITHSRSLVCHSPIPIIGDWFVYSFNDVVNKGCAIAPACTARTRRLGRRLWTRLPTTW